MSQWIDKFDQYLRLELNRSLNTTEAYRRDLTEFASWITNNRIDTFNPIDVTTSDMRAWLASSASKLSHLTLRRKAQSLRAFYRWLHLCGKINTNPAADLQLAKAPKHLPTFIKETEIEELLNELQSRQDFASIRARMILLLLYSTGIRQEELRTLTDYDIDYSLGEMRVTGKRNKQRVIPLPIELMNEIQEWQSTRDAHNQSSSEIKALFPGEHGFISRATLYRIVNLGLASTSSSKKSPHVLRHTFATAMLNNGAALDSVKEFLGHTSLSTTQIYTHLSFAELNRTYRAAHPRAKK